MKIWVTPGHISKENKTFGKPLANVTIHHLLFWPCGEMITICQISFIYRTCSHGARLRHFSFPACAWCQCKMAAVLVCKSIRHLKVWWSGRRIAQSVARDPCAEALQRTRVRLPARVPLLRVTPRLLPCFLSKLFSCTVNKAEKRPKKKTCLGSKSKQFTDTLFCFPFHR